MIKIKRGDLIGNVSNALTDLLNSKQEKVEQSKLLASTLKRLYKEVLVQSKENAEKMEDLIIEFGQFEGDRYQVKQNHDKYKEWRKSVKEYHNELIEIDMDKIDVDEVSNAGINLEPVYLIVLDDIIK